MRALFSRRRPSPRLRTVPPVAYPVCGHGLTRCVCMTNPDATVWIRPTRGVRHG